MATLIHHTKRVQFLGLPSPFSDPAIQAMKARGQLTPRRRKELHKMESRRQMQGFCRYPGVTVKVIGPADGLSREYRWDTGNGFVADMEEGDITHLMGMHLAHPQAFRVLDDLVVVSG